MKKQIIALICLTCLSGCYYNAGFVEVRHDKVNVGRAAVGDSVSAEFKFRNNSGDTLKLMFIPECECTTVSTDVMDLKPGERGQLNVKVAIDSPGEFHKYIFVQADGYEDFFTVAVTGRAR